MPKALRLDLTAVQRAELDSLWDHATRPYSRERAAALLKVAADQPVWAVAHTALLKRRGHELYQRRFIMNCGTNFFKVH